MPGAISIRVTPSGRSSNTARSVMYRTGCFTCTAYLPEKVMCSTWLTNFFLAPSWVITSLPSRHSVFRPLAVKVPQ